MDKRILKNKNKSVAIDREATEYLLSTKANRDELFNSINELKKGKILTLKLSDKYSFSNKD